MEILMCDKCGFQLTEKEEIELAMEGVEAWQNACLARGQKPRGYFPCKHYRNCEGEMMPAKQSGRQK